MNRVAIAALVAVLSMRCETPPSPPDFRAENSQLRVQLEAEKKKNTLERQYIEEATKTINSVHDQLATLQPIESTLRDVERNKAEGVAISPTQREDMLAAIDAVQQSLQNDAKQLEEFRARTQNAEGKVAGLEETITKLQAIANAKNKEIAELRESLRQMSDTVTTLQQKHESDQGELEKTAAELRRLTSQLAETTTRMYEVRYLRGTVGALVRQGVLQETRRFFRRTVTLAPNAPLEQFETGDSRALRELAVEGPRDTITLYPPRPVVSFHIVPQNGNSSSLVVDEPDVFWQTRFVVVAVDR